MCGGPNCQCGRLSFCDLSIHLVDRYRSPVKIRHKHVKSFRTCLVHYRDRHKLDNVDPRSQIFWAQGSHLLPHFHRRRHLHHVLCLVKHQCSHQNRKQRLCQWPCLLYIRILELLVPVLSWRLSHLPCGIDSAQGPMQQNLFAITE